MKNIYLYALLVFSFGMLAAKQVSSQTRAEVDSIKTWTDDFLKKAQTGDDQLIIDTLWVDNAKQVENRGDFGVYNTGRCSDGSCSIPSLVIKYLATKIQDRELQDKIDLANGVMPGVYSHESSHREKMDLIYGTQNFSWSLYDNFQRILSSELSARLAESFSMRTEVLSGAVSKNMIRNIADNLPESKLYNKDYFLWLSRHDISKNISKTEADLMLSSLIRWMSTAKTDMYFENAAVFASFYKTNNIGSLLNQKKKQKLMDFDSFMTSTFLQPWDGLDYNIFQLADRGKVDEFLQTIAKSMKQYEQMILKGDEHIKSGWGKSIEKLNSKYKKDVKKHEVTKLRAEKHMGD